MYSEANWTLKGLVCIVAKTALADCEVDASPEVGSLVSAAAVTEVVEVELGSRSRVARSLYRPRTRTQTSGKKKKVARGPSVERNTCGLAVRLP